MNALTRALHRILAPRTGDATATNGGIANTGTIRNGLRLAAPPAYDRSPVFAQARQEWAAKYCVGRTVTTHRRTLNACENLLTHIAGNAEALNALGPHFGDPQFIVGLRVALSAAIEAADFAAWHNEDNPR